MSIRPIKQLVPPVLHPVRVSSQEKYKSVQVYMEIKIRLSFNVFIKCEEPNKPEHR